MGYSLNTASDHVWRFRHNPAAPVKAGTAPLYSGLISEAATTGSGSAAKTVGYAYDAARRLTGTRLYVGNPGTESWTPTLLCMFCPPCCRIDVD